MCLNKCWMCWAIQQFIILHTNIHYTHTNTTCGPVRSAAQLGGHLSEHKHFPSGASGQSSLEYKCAYLCLYIRKSSLDYDSIKIFIKISCICPPHMEIVIMGRRGRCVKHWPVCKALEPHASGPGFDPRCWR